MFIMDGVECIKGRLSRRAGSGSGKLTTAMVVVGLTAIACAAGCLGQTPDDAHPIRHVPSPERIIRILRQGSLAEKRELAGALQLMEPPEWLWGDGENFCTSFESVKLNYVVLEKPGPQAVIHVVPTICYGTEFVVVLQREAENEWKLVRTIPLDTQIWTARISFPALVQPDEREIMIHDYTAERGTGMWQKDLVIWKLLQDRLEVVFDEVESLSFYVATGRMEEETGNTEQSQESVFTIEPADLGQSGYKDIIEKQTVKDHKTTIVRWKGFAWRPSLQRFQGNPTYRDSTERTRAKSSR
jgi:hypothetical protein